MKRFLRFVAILLTCLGLTVWFVAGANRGWTKNRVEKRTIDEITGIEGISYEQRFVPGIDFLAGIAVGAGALAAVSFLFRKKEKQML